MFTSNNSDLLRILAKSTAEYVYSRIHVVKNKEYYAQGIIDAFRIMDRSSTVEEFRRDVLLHKERTEFMKKAKWFSNVNPRGYYEMALNHILNVQESIERRFDSNLDPSSVPLNLSTQKDNSVFGHL